MRRQVNITVQVRISKKLHRALKLEAARTNKTMGQLLDEKMLPEEKAIKR